MPKITTQYKIDKLYDFIYSKKNQLETINETNSNLIMQYCRFVVLSDELSEKIQADSTKLPVLTDAINVYKEYNKIVLGLHKVLKFDKLKNELQNPFAEILAGDDDDD